MDRTRASLFTALVVSLTLKLALWSWIAATDPPRFWDNGTSAGYFSSAQALVDHHVFARGPDRPNVPETLRTPAYPAFLAVSIALFGDSLSAVILLQILLSIGTLVLLAHLARALFRDARVATLAVWIVALDSVSLSFSQLVLPETLFTFALVASGLAGVQACTTAGTARRAVVAGLALAGPC